MSLDALLAVLQPPVSPVGPGEPDLWPGIESRLGSPLPPDYKSYITRFGSGMIGNFITPLSPFSANPYVDLLKQVPVRLDALRVLKSRHGESEVPYALFPEKGGLLPWGFTENGDVFFWRCIDEAAKWPTVLNAGRDARYEHFNLTMTDVLASLLRRRISSRILPTDWPTSDAAFSQP